jgi:hypothetical protein
VAQQKRPASPVDEKLLNQHHLTIDDHVLNDNKIIRDLPRLV